jgi:hypothetical protein
VSILHNDFAIENGIPARELACGSDNAGIAVAPIMTIPSVGKGCTTLD